MSVSEISPEIIDAAYQMGGKRLVEIVTRLNECLVVFPISAGEAIRFAGVGKVSIENLQAIGLVERPFPPDFDGLSCNTAALLVRCGATSKEEAIHIITGKHPKGYGPKTHRELCAWAGI